MKREKTAAEARSTRKWHEARGRSVLAFVGRSLKRLSNSGADMKPRELIGTARIPGGNELRLFRRGGDFMIVLDRNELMSSRMSGSGGSARHDDL